MTASCCSELPPTPSASSVARPLVGVFGRLGGRGGGLEDMFMAGMVEGRVERGRGAVKRGGRDTWSQWTKRHAVKCMDEDEEG